MSHLYLSMVGTTTTAFMSQFDLKQQLLVSIDNSNVSLTKISFENTYFLPRLAHVTFSSSPELISIGHFVILQRHFAK
jgi:hypothetical protein